MTQDEKVTENSQSELDKKLENILFKASGGVTDMCREEVKRVKEAFVEAGWLTPGTYDDSSLEPKALQSELNV